MLGRFDPPPTGVNKEPTIKFAFEIAAEQAAAQTENVAPEPRPATIYQSETPTQKVDLLENKGGEAEREAYKSQLDSLKVHGKIDYLFLTRA